MDVTQEEWRELWELVREAQKDNAIQNTNINNLCDRIATQKDEIKELPEKYNHLPRPEVRPSEGTNEAVIWHFFAGAPKQHRMSELEHCNAIWNTVLLAAERGHE